MPRTWISQAILILTFFPLSLPAQTASPKENPAVAKPADHSIAKPETIESQVERYLRNLYAWGPKFQVKVGPSTPSPVPELLEIPVTVTLEGQSDTATVYASRNGKFLFRGDLTDMSVDPFADVRSKLHVGNSPTLGPEDAKITLIEFGDLECPSCRQLDLVLRELLPRHPEIRFVFKHFPLTNMHPWAMTAAIATQCAFQQSNAAFWKMHDAIYDAQDIISPSNVWDKIQDLATKEGLNPEAFKACLINPETAKQVNEIIEEGHAVAVTATPTTFINGHRLVGPDKSQLEQQIDFNQAPQ